ncbi:hypothetical protein IP91_00121 [Pseudoduganella lurida]|uniref:Uncharacterized protein n=1 Tax=Pseudoduganella lurida TaxID=1036180 RepID=A0A562RKU8_9BURK|nr:hypothetical protein [Pseudoduganella lurida]TWI69056.1 hypothetical protein IP91_00121 [Pseudoduganella lurida]
MDFDYIQTRDDARQVLIDFGGAEPGLTFARTTKGGHVPGAGGPAAGSTITTVAIGVMLPYGQGTTAREGSLILASDQRAYVAAVDLGGAEILAPAKGDKCLAPDGQTYNVENVWTTAPAGIPVLYELQLRR